MILSLFLLRMMDGIQVLNTAMYLIYLYLFFLVGLGGCIEEVGGIAAGIMSVR